MSMEEIKAKQIPLFLSYDPETGKLHWKARDEKWFTSSWRAAAWNTRYAGREAISCVGTHGYLCGYLFGVKVDAHRVIWAIIHGEWPREQIDHINGDRADNRIANLRHVTRAENQRNLAKRTDNTSGITGVGWSKQKGKWFARICVCNHVKHLGFFDNIEQAAAARRSALEKYGFHEMHGFRAGRR